MDLIPQGRLLLGKISDKKGEIGAAGRQEKMEDEAGFFKIDC